jgi:HEAT repeat protein
MDMRQRSTHSLLAILAATLIGWIPDVSSAGPEVPGRLKPVAVGQPADRPVSRYDAQWYDKTLRQLLAQLKDNDADRRLEAVKMLQPMLSFIDLGRCCLGPCPVHEQIGILDVPDALPKLIDVLGDPEPDIRAEAAELLSSCGPYAAPAVPRLTEMLSNRQTARQSLVALAAVGPAAASSLPEVRKKLQDLDPQIRMAAVQAVWNIGGDSAVLDTCSSLLALEDPRRSVLLDFMRERMGVRAAPVVPTLIRMLDSPGPYGGDPHGQVRTNCIRLLGAIGPPAKAAIPSLIRLAGDNNLRYWCIPALGQMGPAAKDAVPLLVKSLAALDSRAQFSFENTATIQAVGNIGPAAAAAIPNLIAQLPGGNGWAAIDALGKIGSPAANADLELLLANKDLCVPAALAKWRIRHNPQSLNILIEALKSDSLNAAPALAEMGPDGKAAASALRSLLRTDSRLANASTAEALWRVAGDRAALDWLEKTMRVNTPSSPAAAAALWRINRRAEAKAYLIRAQFQSATHDEAHRLIAHLGPSFYWPKPN